MLVFKLGLIPYDFQEIELEMGILLVILNVVFSFLRRSSISLRHTSVIHSPVVGRKILHHLRKWFSEL